MPKIVIYYPGINVGGVERVFSTYATGLSRRGHDVHYVACTGKSDLRASLHNNVHFTDLGAEHMRTSIPALLKFLRRERPDFILTAGVPTLVAFIAKLLSGSRAKLVTSHHCYINVESNALIHHVIIKYLYPRCHKVIAVSSGIASLLVDHFRLAPEKVVTIYNPIDVDQIHASSGEEICVPREYVLFAGRLEKVKNLCLLMDAFNIFAQNHPELKLLLLGDGREAECLKKYAEEHYPDSGICFLGKSSNPYPYIARARVVALSSQSEALPTILTESMALGITSVSTPTLGGVDILNEGEYGYISASLDDAASFAKQLENAYNNPKDGGVLRRIAQNTYGVEEKLSDLEKLINA